MHDESRDETNIPSLLQRLKIERDEKKKKKYKNRAVFFPPWKDLPLTISLSVSCRILDSGSIAVSCVSIESHLI